MNFLGQFFQFITAPVRWLMSIPLWVISSPRRIWGMSLPARAAALVFLVLFLCLTAAMVAIVWNRHDRAADLRNYFYNPTFPAVVALVFIIPIVVYYWLKLWLEGDVSRFPDIDAAWNDGLAALQENGFDVGSLPLFLVIGAPDERLAKSLFKATGFDLVVRDTPAGLAPLRFHADDRAIYVSGIALGSLGKLHQMARSSSGQSGNRVPDVRGTMEPSGGIRGTMVAGGGDIRGTALATSSMVTESGPGVQESLSIRGTLVPGAGGGSAPRSGGTTAAPSHGSSLLSRRDSELEAERLYYVCELLRRARRPVCPINGALVLLPLDAVQQVLVARDIPAAIKQDLDTIRHGTRLRAPVTVLVTGMEQEPGFGELVRRVGASKAKANRFGKGYDVWNPPTEENIDAFSSHACGAFEDWVYSLFRERDGLTKPGNAKLFTLLCKIRSEIRARLRGILLHGISLEGKDQELEAAPPLFNGCYFAATGDTEDRQAFVRNVFEKMLDQEEELEWTPEAVSDDRRHHFLADIGMIADVALILSIVGMLAVRFWR